MSDIIVRVAPSPTGRLHLGNARAALFNDLFARAQKGRLILRLDDTDQERSTEAFAQGILEDLSWLGIYYHTVVRQSDRLDRYHEQAQLLKSLGRLYPCYETPDELNLKRKQQLARKQPPVYDRAALKLTEEQRRAFEQEGRKPHWRFLLTDEPITWHDMIRGTITMQGKHLSDPVLIRADGQPVYTLASVIDDQDMGVTHIIRGEDHITNTAVQLQIWKALGCQDDRFILGHFPLIVDASGAGFSKREGSLSLAMLREEGIEPMAIASLLAHLGSSHDIAPYPDMDTLAHHFDLGQVSKNPPHFHHDMLIHMNQKWYGVAPYATLQERLQNHGYARMSEDAWHLIRDNVTTFKDVEYWYHVVYGELTCPAFSSEDQAFLARAQACFQTLQPQDPWWNTWIPLVKEETQRQGPNLFKPLRRALTGLEGGPDLKALMALMGYDRVLNRLKQGVASSS